MNTLDIIKKFMDRYGTSQSFIAEKLNISRESMFRRFHGLTDFRLEEIPILAKLFGTTTDYLLNGKEEVVE